MTRTGHWDAVRSEGSLVQEDAELKPLTASCHTRPRHEAVQSHLPAKAPASHCQPLPLKPLFRNQGGAWVLSYSLPFSLPGVLQINS